MEKFEKVLSLFIKNPYRNVELSENSEKRISSYISSFFSLMALLSILSLILGQFIINNLILKNNYYIQLNIVVYIYYVLILIIFIVGFYVIYNYFNIKNKIKDMSFFSFIFSSIVNILLPLIPLNALFLIETIQLKTIYIYYLVYIYLITYYYWFYYSKWKRKAFYRKFKLLKEQLKNLNNNLDWSDFVSKFNLNEDEKDKPKLTKIAEIVIGFMMRFGFTLPILAVLASSGTGGNGMIYFAIYLMFFIIPEMSQATSKQFVLFKLIKQIEKEENVTIYNGRVKN
jgi:hypothetical protein